MKTKVRSAQRTPSREERSTQVLIIAFFTLLIIGVIVNVIVNGIPEL